MGASEKGVEELLPQKICHKNNFNCICTSGKTNCIVTTKKRLSEELNTGISSKYLINTQ